MYVSFARIIFLFLVWFTASQLGKPFFVISAIVCVWLSWWVAQQMNLFSEKSLFTKLHQKIFYLGWLFKEMAISAISVSKIIWQIKPRIRPQLFNTHSKLTSDLALSLYGNSITLTPGTICVDISEDHVVQVHALEREGRKDITSHRMEKRVRKAMV